MMCAGRRAIQTLHCAVVGALIVALGPTALAEPLVTRTSLTDKSDNGTRLGAYDPYGTFANDPRIGIEHIYIPWQDVDLASLIAADRYARSAPEAYSLLRSHGPGPDPGNCCPQWTCTAASWPASTI